jgi:photosystem II stability/assembly factor-like uncharacterized protein
LRTDDGVTWTEASAGLPPSRIATALALHPQIPSTLYVAISPNLVYRSLDGAKTWQVTRTAPPMSDVRSLTVTRQGVLYAGGNGPLVRSADGGATWLPAGNSPPTNVRTIAADPFVAEAMYVGGDDVARKSIDGGTTWTSLNILFVNTFAWAGPSTILAGTTGAGVARSNDAGSSWTPGNTGLVCSSIRAVALGADTPRTLYAGTSGGIMTTIDQGKSWSLSSSPRLNVFAFAVDQSSWSTVYAGGSSIVRTVDSGATWTSLGGADQPGVHAMIVDPNDNRKLYAGSQTGIWKSSDAGVSWTQCGMPGTWISSLAADPRWPPDQ